MQNMKKRKAVLVVLLLAFTFISFALPKETFDPHLGVDYDIFCQLSSYLNIDLLDLGWIRIFVISLSESFYPELDIIFLSEFLISLNSIRAPPSNSLSLIAA